MARAGREFRDNESGCGELSHCVDAEHGHKRVSHIERCHVRQIRDAKAETSGASNTILRMMKILLNFAVAIARPRR
jgi:hypothetical protein